MQIDKADQSELICKYSIFKLRLSGQRPLSSLKHSLSAENAIGGHSLGNYFYEFETREIKCPSLKVIL